MSKQTTNLLYYLAIIGLLFWFAYSKGWILANFRSIEAKTALTMLQKDDNVTLLDVRTIEEYKQGHLPHSKIIPLQVLEANIAMLEREKPKQIIVYCRTGNRSVSASRILESYGFTPLNVKGGIIQLVGVGATLTQ